MSSGHHSTIKTTAEFEARSLHLHTLDSLLSDLVSGRAIVVGDDQLYALPDDRTRSALDWYRKRGEANWGAAVSATHAENLVDAIQGEPIELEALPARPLNANARRLTLRKLEAHRFAGLHKFGTPSDPPDNYIHEFSPGFTLFEGRNGSGKTSLANAIIWVLTGELLRAQREPESAKVEFECKVGPAESGAEATMHRITPVTPLPDAQSHRPDRDFVHADTWVELTFVDETGAELPPIRRTQSRSTQGRLNEVPPDLSLLGLDPIAVRIGTVMPGLLSVIRVGGESELGRAVGELTGLASLIDLADHARRAKQKIGKDFVKAKTAELEGFDRSYETARSDLAKVLEDQPDLAIPQAIPSPSNDKSIEEAITGAVSHFDAAKAKAFEAAQAILGEQFDPNDRKIQVELEQNISVALSELERLNLLPSFSRLKGLGALAAEELKAAEDKLENIVHDAKVLAELDANPSSAARARLYAHVASWLADHPDPNRDDDLCVVCGHSIGEAIDPVSGNPVGQHLHDAQGNATLLAQTLARWAKAAHAELIKSLPPSLQSELSQDLPDHPCDLVRMAILDELFEARAFKGVLDALRSETAASLEKAVEGRTELVAAREFSLPPHCEDLSNALQKLDVALRFAKWRQESGSFLRDLAQSVLGKRPKQGEPIKTDNLTGKLLQLDAIVRQASPITNALELCTRIKRQLDSRRSCEKRLAEYAIASEAIGNLLELGTLADKQIDQLRNKLSEKAAAWRNRIYLGAFPSTAHRLVGTAMGRKGEIDLFVESDGVSAPAQHVVNASALRASLVGFYLAFWEHVIADRGGLRTLILDDAQELLDDENRQRLASGLANLAGSAQLILTSYDPRFASFVIRAPSLAGIKHFSVQPATVLQPVIRTTPSQSEIARRHELFEVDRNQEEPARDFADGCRVYLEAMLGDLFDDPAHSTWARQNSHPTLASFVTRLRPLVKVSPQGMFASNVFRRFVDHPSLADNSPVLQLMNKAHHGQRHEIRAAEVDQCAADLVFLVEQVERLFEECCRWRQRDAPPQPTEAVVLPLPLQSMRSLERDFLICPDLAAFTHETVGETQEAPDVLNRDVFDGKSAFFLRRDNFGFAAPQGAIAIVDSHPSPVDDRRLVVARREQAIYARRLLRSQGSDMVGLTAEIPDPRVRSPKSIFVEEARVALHRVVGVIFDHHILVEPGGDEAVEVDASAVIEQIEIAFRVVDESAVPLALEKQVVLGGPTIPLDHLASNVGALVAISLEDGSSVFKRIGAALPAPLAHLRQFESIGGLGVSQVFAVGREQTGMRRVRQARRIIGVLYNV